MEDNTVFQEAIGSSIYWNRPNHEVTYKYECAGCGKIVEGYAIKRVRGHVFCAKCRKNYEKHRAYEKMVKEVLKPYNVSTVEEIVQIVKTETAIQIGDLLHECNQYNDVSIRYRVLCLGLHELKNTLKGGAEMKIKRIYRCGDYEITEYSNGEKTYKKVIVRVKEQK